MREKKKGFLDKLKDGFGHNHNKQNEQPAPAPVADDIFDGQDLPEENTIILHDDDGNELVFEFLDLIEYKGLEYVVLLPTDETAEEVIILRLEEGETEDEESYVSVEDDSILQAVFAIFKERFQDIFNFTD